MQFNNRYAHSAAASCWTAPTDCCHRRPIAPHRDAISPVRQAHVIRIARLDGVQLMFPPIHAGDLRGAFYPTLTLLHSVFVRLHNYLARGLRAVHPLWSDDQTFQETKRVTTAVYQNIVYNEWAPLVLGKEMAAQRNISWDGSSPYSGWYNKSLDGSTMNDFTSGAFRMLHVNTPSEINLFDNGAWTTTMRFCYADFIML